MSPTLAAKLAPVSNLKLRELGIFALPDQREFVVSTLYADGCCLYSRYAWAHKGSAEFWVDKDGRLLKDGVPTQWSVEDLKDTGKTTKYPKPRFL